MVVSTHQPLGRPGTDSPSLLSGHTLVWTSRVQNWERFHFHEPLTLWSFVKPQTPLGGTWASEPPRSFQMCEGSVSFSESLPLSFSSQSLAENCSPSPISPSSRVRLYHHLCQTRVLAQCPPLLFHSSRPLLAWPCFLPS